MIKPRAPMGQIVHLSQFKTVEIKCVFTKTPSICSFKQQRGLLEFLFTLKNIRQPVNFITLYTLPHSVSAPNPFSIL